MRVSGAEVLRVSKLGPGGFISVMGNGATAPVAGRGGELNAASEFHLVNPAPVEMSEALHVAELIDHEPDVREDVVASLRARIESGGYQVSGEQIAEMMVRRFLADRVR